MTIRSKKNLKDHRPEHLAVESIALIKKSAQQKSPLRFWTAHPTKPCFVDLTVFHDGLTESIKGKKSSIRPFSGRPKLILEMAAYIEDHVAPLAEKSVNQFKASLRAWWQLFDSIEKTSPEIPRVASTADLTEFHRQYAFDNRMNQTSFSSFILLANKTRISLGLGLLYWPGPGHRPPSRHLPPLEHFDAVRHELRHRWFDTLRRWEATDKLLQSTEPIPPEECLGFSLEEQNAMRHRFRLWDATAKATGRIRPTIDEIKANTTSSVDWESYAYSELIRGRYPDNDIRTAFYLCLATTGWNPAVLLALDLNTPFLFSHPKDKSRYVLRGIKDRAGGAEIIYMGLEKSRGGAGYILKQLIARTAPLRDELQRDLERVQKKLRLMETDSESYNTLVKQSHKLEALIRSPWLYVPTNRRGFARLTDYDYAGHRSEFMPTLISDINRKRPKEKLISPFPPTHFRDAVASRTYLGGGLFLGVNRVLGHKQLESTTGYLSNTLLREEHAKIYAAFSFALWDELENRKGVDPTILAYRSKFGDVPESERSRLAEYRKLLRSRLDIGCKDPLHPPKHIAPDFDADGKKKCHVQRCLLCLEHAVIFPESLPGICMRLAELRHLRATMSLQNFASSTFVKELENCEIAILGFDQRQVEEHLELWAIRIANGNHRVAAFDGEV